jgi:ABC-2 type transport system ATP-binding protein
MEPALQLCAVSKSFGTVQAVQGIDLAIHPSELVGIVGPDGAGKTTLARLAAGVLAPTSGRVAPESRGRVGYLSGRFSLYPELTVQENLTFFARIYGMSRADTAKASTELLAWVGLLPFANRLSGHLSGGMRQKLALACAVIHQPPLLILDEPTTAVDPVARRDFWALLKEQAKQGRAVLVTTPYLDEAEHCDRVALLHQGRILALDQVGPLLERLPYAMFLLSPTSGQVRKAWLAAAAQLDGCEWTFPVGTGVKVALLPGATPSPPAGYTLSPLAPTLEDLYLWLSGTAKEVQPA